MPVERLVPIRKTFDMKNYLRNYFSFSNCLLNFLEKLVSKPGADLGFCRAEGADFVDV